MLLIEETNRDIDLVAVNNYYPFVMLQPGQILSSERYRFGFIPKESGQALKDNEKINKWSNYDRRS
jgi:hypothetical protein